MKIGFNVKKIKDTLDLFETSINNLMNEILNHGNRIETLEENSSEWIEITSSNRQEAEITQNFSEIRMQAKTNDTLYSVTCHYNSNIFHNTTYNGPTYIITGNPIENNFGCKFKYMVNSSHKQYVCVDKCFNGGSQEGIDFRAWIKPVSNTGTQ